MRRWATTGLMMLLVACGGGVAYAQPFPFEIHDGVLMTELDGGGQDITDVNDITGTVTQEFVPAGGTAGQVLSKDSATDYDVSWVGGTGDIVAFDGYVHMASPIGNGVNTIAVDVTALGLSAAPDWIQAVVENDTDADPFIISAQVTAKTSTTLTFALSGTTDTGDYVLMSVFGANAGQVGTQAIGSGVAAIAVDLTGFGLSAAPSWAQATVENTTDADPFIISAQVTAKSTTSMTFALTGTTDSVNYDLKWKFVE